MKRTDENLDEYGDRLAKMHDKQIVKEIRSYKRYSGKPALLDLAIMEFAMEHWSRKPHEAQGLINVYEPARYSYEKEDKKKK